MEETPASLFCTWYRTATWRDPSLVPVDTSKASDRRTDRPTLVLKAACSGHNFPGPVPGGSGSARIHRDWDPPIRSRPGATSRPDAAARRRAGQQALSPIQIAVGQQSPAVLRLHENIEVCEIVRRVPQRVGCVQAERQNDTAHAQRDFSAHVPRCRRQSADANGYSGRMCRSPMANRD